MVSPRMINNRYPPEYRPRNPIEELEMLGELSNTEEDYSSTDEDESNEGEEESEEEYSDSNEAEVDDIDHAALPSVNRDVIIPFVQVPTTTPPAPSNGGANDMSMLLTDPDIFDCYVCYETLSIPVYQCVNGHILCSTCCCKVGHKCPLCSMLVGDKRCRAMEAVLASMKSACSNARYGCKMMVRYSEKREHDKTCAFVPCSCPQPNCNWLSHSSQLGQHLTQDHSFYIISFQYGQFFNVRFRYNTRFRFLQSSSDGKLFVINNQMEDTKNLVFLSHIGPNSLVSQFYYEVKAMSNGGVLLPQTSVETTQGGTFALPLRFSSIPHEMLSLSRWIDLQFRITTHSDEGPSTS
ncbi:E3 ubiquitin-protein ligase SINA-like 10, partial [Mucuna pruriens]